MGGGEGKKGKKDSSASHNRLIGLAATLGRSTYPCIEIAGDQGRFSVIKGRRCKMSCTSFCCLLPVVIFSFYPDNLWAMLNLIYMSSKSGRPRIFVLTMTALTVF